jgi:7-cyano-7-deazaguanine synthase
MKSIVSLSGGMDSATVLAYALTLSRDVKAVGFSYGSKHNIWENIAAERVASHYQISYRLIDLSEVMKHFKSNLLLTGGKIPEGHYEEKSMELTVVPARNMIFCSILAGIAVSEEANCVWIGVHAGDFAIYPDCRPYFVNLMEKTIGAGTGKNIDLRTPFLHDYKKDILRWGLEYKVPYHLTRTCYTSDELACGRCGSCQERLTAFRDIGGHDPIPYASRLILPKSGL